jgi:hypothetical protein
VFRRMNTTQGSAISHRYLRLGNFFCGTAPFSLKLGFTLTNILEAIWAWPKKFEVGKTNGASTLVLLRLPILWTGYIFTFVCNTTQKERGNGEGTGIKLLSGLRIQLNVVRGVRGSVRQCSRRHLSGVPNRKGLHGTRVLWHLHRRLDQMFLKCWGRNKAETLPGTFPQHYECNPTRLFQDPYS